jgi:POT family proton-dependent oligopeptide transporter
VTDVADATRDEKTFFGQPRVLANLFGVEMWERFSFYGMQGILLIYLYYSTAEGGLGINQTTATSIVGAYGGLVYLSTILGAWLADRVLSAERTLFYSAIVVMVGHIALALLPGLLGVGVGLVLVAVAVEG